jgi:hypothetical protein
MDIANQRQQIFVPIADNGFVPALEEMADFAIASVEMLGVGLLQSLHEFGQRNATSLHQQVDVVGHQAVGVDPDMALGAVSL